VREFTKSVISYGWASTVFQVQQLANVMTTNPDTGNSAATDAYNELARATAQQLGPALHATYRAGDAMQRSMVNVMFGMVGMGSDSPSGNRQSGSGHAATGTPARISASTPTGGATRPSWREPRRPDASPIRRPDPIPFAAPVPAAAAADSEARGAQGWGPMP